MDWRYVLFANWPVDPAIVDANLPDALSVDTYDGDAWLSVVPFTNLDVRPKGLPASMGMGLPEINLRTYVTHDGKPSVYFLSLDADGVLGVIGARLFHHLPYYSADISLERTGEKVEFTSVRNHPGTRPAAFHATYEPTGEELDVGAGSLERFLSERYRYYTETPGGELRYADIEHPQWPLFDATVDIETNEIFSANGFDHPETEPVHFYSPGVDVVASESKRAAHSTESAEEARSGGLLEPVSGLGTTAAQPVTDEYGDDPILLFDGVCNLCSGVVQYVAPRDTGGTVRFASLQSDAGNAILETIGMPTDQLETMILVEGDQYYTKSDAAIRLARHLGGIYALGQVGAILPRSVRDELYNLVAANRYRLFGKKEQCMMPSDDIRSRFVE
jgi:uncharacterized protein YqjF (DUF2071 family)/predicted DCC family thiol-disulfide oxidoreductase YuxK